MGRLLKPQDRLNSIGKYFPYGEDRVNPTPANPPNGQEKFATYTRDAETGLDYAYQRYYASGLGRFMTVDSSNSSGHPQNPSSWNRYVYAVQNPLNIVDPTGDEGIPADCYEYSSNCLIYYFAYNFGGGGSGDYEKQRPDPRGKFVPGASLVTNAAEARRALIYAINHLSASCQKVLAAAGDPSTVLLATADAIHFYNGAAQASTLLSTIPGVAPVQGTQTTLGGAVGKSYAVTLLGAAGGLAVSNTVDLGAAFFNATYPAPAGAPPLSYSQQVAGQLTTLLHEELHFLDQAANDPQLESDFRIGPSPLNSNMNPIDYWLTNGCPQTPKQ